MDSLPVPAVPRQYMTNINWTDIRVVQAEITRWAQERFPHRTDFHALHKLVLSEIPELVTHKKEHGTEDIGLELADCFILLLDLGSLWGVDIASAIQNKMAVNYLREWDKDENGIMQHKRIPDPKPFCYMVDKPVEVCADYPNCPCGDQT